jgi:uridine kinase
VRSYESVSTWRPSPPPVASARRQILLADLADEIGALGPGRLRVAIDGRTGAGKSTFGMELAHAIGERGRPTLRASLDDFKRPWRDAVELGYDRTGGEGYYRNAPDFESARSLLLEPAGPAGSGSVALCAHDPLTGVDHRHVRVTAPPDAVLVVDSVFALRPEYRDVWDLSVWLDVDEDTSLRRALERDAARDGAEEVERVHRERYAAAEAIYLAEVDPVGRATVVIDNRDVDWPRRLR